MIHSRKGQIMIEHIATHVWALLIFLIAIGALFYFDLFNTEKYAAQFCTFDSNYFCHDYVIQQNGANEFNMLIALQNNMNKNIVLNRTKLLDKNGGIIICTNGVNLYCRYNDTDVFQSATPSDQEFQVDDGSKEWSPTKICMIEYLSCDRPVYSGLKIQVDVELNFSGVDKNATHLSYGRVYANVIE